MSNKSPYENIQIPAEEAGFIIDDSGDYTAKILGGNLKLSGSYSTLEGGENVKVAVPSKEVVGYRMVVTGNNLYSQLTQMMPFIEDGPFIAEGRDNELKIHNRNFNQKPVLTFIFKGGTGDLMSFSAKTNKKSKLTDAITSTKIDEEEKELEVMNTQLNTSEEGSSQPIQSEADTSYEKIRGKVYFNNPKILNVSVLPRANEGVPNRTVTVKAKDRGSIIKDINTNFEPTIEEKKQYVENQLKPQFNSLVEGVKSGDPKSIAKLMNTNQLPNFIVKKREWVARWVNPIEYWEMAMYDRGIDEKVVQDIQKSGSSNYYNRWNTGFKYLKKAPGIKLISGVSYKYGPGQGEGDKYGKVYIASLEEVEVPIDGARILSKITPNDFTSEYVSNQLNEAHHKQIEATAKIKGYPGLECGRVISIFGVSKKYSGNWYITDIKHSIGLSGYTCELSLIKAPSSSLISQVTSSVNTKSMYASIAKLAEERVQRDASGINIQKEVDLKFKQFIEQEKQKAIQEGRNPNDIDESSYSAVVEPSGNIKIYSAKEEGVNIRNADKDFIQSIKK